MQRECIAKALHELLVAEPNQDKRKLLAALRERGFAGLSTTDVNSVLYASRSLFASDGRTPPRWRLAGPKAGSRLTLPTAAISPASPRSYVGAGPRAWQQEALAAWLANGRRGVIEAVTGTGKTTVGVLAAAASVDVGQKVLILVPGLELLDQWYEVLRRDLPTVRIGRFGGEHKQDMPLHDIVVATVQSASQRQMLRPPMRGLLIADEVHRYGAATFALALDPEFDARLGLTATYACEDHGLADHLDPYFGGVVHRCDYERGLADGILARFRVGLIGVDFITEEREQYDQYDERARTLRRRLVADHGCPQEPFGEFMTAVTRLSEGGFESSRPTTDARAYLNAFSKRRQLLADCRRKHEALAGLAPMLSSAIRGLVFTETKESARDAARILRRHGVAAMDFTSELKLWERKARLAEFKRGGVRLLTAPRVLDEGIDVPEANVGVILAASRSKRQMIQRMGRVIRPKTDNGPATFIVMYVRDTSEDPANGAHADFLDQLVDVAEETTYFPLGTTSAELLAWHLQGRA